MSRHGKIARLPGPIREQVNVRLQNGENGQDIIAWLNSNDEATAVLAQHFGGQEINDTNLWHATIMNTTLWFKNYKKQDGLGLRLRIRIKIRAGCDGLRHGPGAPSQL